jgi:hypothetical protein
MPWSPRQCRYFETASAKKAGVPEKLRGECHEQYRGTKGGYAKHGPRVRALKRSVGRG